MEFQQKLELAKTVFQQRQDEREQQQQRLLQQKRELWKQQRDQREEENRKDREYAATHKEEMEDIAATILIYLQANIQKCSFSTLCEEGFRQEEIPLSKIHPDFETSLRHKEGRAEAIHAIMEPHIYLLQILKPNEIGCVKLYVADKDPPYIFIRKRTKRWECGIQ